MADRKGLNTAAKLVRRATLANDPALISEISQIIDAQGWDAAVDSLVDRPIDTSVIPSSYEDDFKASETYFKWWFDKILAAPNPVQERMAFFWHTFLTSSRRAAGNKYGLAAGQMNLFRQKSMTSYSELLMDFVRDPLLMRYLNANTNVARRPNENLARELMELFTTGIGPYTEQDIRNAALAISGWRINGDNGNVSYDASKGHQDPVSFLGETKVWDLDSVTQRLLDHPATAKRVSQLLWDELVGPSTAPANLGPDWAAQGYDTKWLVKTILKSDAFKDSDHYVRPRSGFEYYINATRALGLPTDQTYRARNVGQLPWEPPNVAGWPDSEQWLDVGSVLSRTELLRYDYEKVEAGKTATTEQVLDRCSIFEISDQTVAALNDLEGSQNNEGHTAQLRWWVALSSPEAMLT